MMSRSKLSKCIVVPSRLASIFDWNKAKSTVMALDISKMKISIAIAEHPTLSNNNTIYNLQPITYLADTTGRGNTSQDAPHSNSVLKSRHEWQGEKERVYSELKTIVKDNHVCALIVGWPLESSGMPGAACGRVLNLLDFFTGTCS